MSAQWDYLLEGDDFAEKLDFYIEEDNVSAYRMRNGGIGSWMDYDSTEYSESIILLHGHEDGSSSAAVLHRYGSAYDGFSGEYFDISDVPDLDQHVLVSLQPGETDELLQNVRNGALEPEDVGEAVRKFVPNSAYADEYDTLEVSYGSGRFVAAGMGFGMPANALITEWVQWDDGRDLAKFGNEYDFCNVHRHEDVFDVYGRPTLSEDGAMFVQSLASATEFRSLGKEQSVFFGELAGEPVIVRCSGGGFVPIDGFDRVAVNRDIFGLGDAWTHYRNSVTDADIDAAVDGDAAPFGELLAWGQGSDLYRIISDAESKLISGPNGPGGGNSWCGIDRDLTPIDSCGAESQDSMYGEIEL